MLPTLWIIDMYNLMLFIGIFAALFVTHLYLEQIKIDRDLKYTILITSVAAIAGGLVVAILSQTALDLAAGKPWRPFAMTFYGGLIGGVATFLLVFRYYVKRRHPETNLQQLFIIAPGAITIAHAFGRVGCFFAGCCYGIETTSWLGVQFPHPHPTYPSTVYPTQLFEAIFLFILAGVLLLLAFKKQYMFTMPVYLISYGVWRFLIEFIRGDERGAFFLRLSPSQWIALFAIFAGVGVVFLLKKLYLQLQSIDASAS